MAGCFAGAAGASEEADRITIAQREDMSSLEAQRVLRAGESIGPRDPVRILQPYYYDAALQRALAETGRVGGGALLARAAARAVYEDLIGSGRVGFGSPAPEEVFAGAGLGSLDTSGIGAGGGTAVLANAPHAAARVAMFGRSKGPVCDIARGVLAGVLCAEYGEIYRIVETHCAASGDDLCRFTVAVATAADLDALPCEDARLAPGRIIAPDARSRPRENPTDRLAASHEPCMSLPGMGLGRLWALLYSDASHAFALEVPRVMGAKFSTLAPILLTEAAHLGTFYSLGSLVRSPEWREGDGFGAGGPEAWVHTVIGLVNSLGWGSWEVQTVLPGERVAIHIHDGYEVRGWAARRQPAETPICYHARGVLAAIMNVLFLDDLAAPVDLDSSLYNRLFRSPLSFRTLETRCAAGGAPVCELVSNPMSSSWRGFPS